MMPRTPVDLQAYCVAIRQGFLEQPDLHVTVQEAQRLWAIGPPLCECALHELVMEGFLAWTLDNEYCRPSYASCGLLRHVPCER
jgi:hypothetical protein